LGISDYLKKGQDVLFDYESDSGRQRFKSIVEHIEEDLFSVRVIDEHFTAGEIAVNKEVHVIGMRGALQYRIKADIEKVEHDTLVYMNYKPERSHLRVDAYIIFTYKKISQEEFSEQKGKYTQNIYPDGERYFYTPYSFLRDDSESLSEAVPPDIANELNSIHKKLDIILKLLMRSEEKNIYNEKPCAVNLSGSGLKFLTDDDIRVDDYLDIKMVLPISSGILIELLGEVVRCVSIKDEKKNEIAVKFAAINEDEREIIIRYVFKRQRELLRAKEGTPE